MKTSNGFFSFLGTFRPPLSPNVSERSLYEPGPHISLFCYSFSKKMKLSNGFFHISSFFLGFCHKIWALLGLLCGPMYPNGLYFNLDLLFHYFAMVLAKNWSLVTDSFQFWSFLVIFSWFLA